jgi:hypothetical protein
VPRSIDGIYFFGLEKPSKIIRFYRYQPSFQLKLFSSFQMVKKNKIQHNRRIKKEEENSLVVDANIIRSLPFLKSRE